MNRECTIDITPRSTNSEIHDSRIVIRESRMCERKSGFGFQEKEADETVMSQTSLERRDQRRTLPASICL